MSSPPPAGRSGAEWHNGLTPPDPSAASSSFSGSPTVSEVANERAARLAKLPFEIVGGPRPGFVRGTIGSIRELFQRRELIGMLVRRELKVKYKDSSLGFLWTLVKPITLLLIYYFAIGVFLKAADSIPMFAIYVFSGLTIWSLYQEMVSSGTGSIYSNAGLIRKVYLPREVFPIASVGSALINFAVQFGVLLVAILVLGQFPLTWNVFYVFPAVFVVLLFGTALAILLSALNVYLRDIAYLVEVAIMVFFWASPIVYSWQMVSDSSIGDTWVAVLYLLNPITIAILAFQNAMWLGGPSVQAGLAEKGIDPSAMMPDQLNILLIGAIVIGIVFLWFSQRMFDRLQGNFAQEI
jgi:ABC-2 type transport system permease protein